MAAQFHRDSSVSQVQGVLLLVVITVVLVTVLLAFILSSLLFESGCECRIVPNPPELIKIINIDNTKTGAGKYRSVVTIENTASYSFPNDDLRLELLINGERVRQVPTLNGHNFISTHHNGVQFIGGTGCQTKNMIPKSRISIDFSDNTIFPGELVTVRIYLKGTCPEEEDMGFFLDSHAFLDAKCRNDWVMYYIHGIDTCALSPVSSLDSSPASSSDSCLISEHSVESP